MKSVWVSSGVAAALVALVSCGSSTDNGGPAQGTERGACYGNHTCNAGLSCISDLCVDANGGGGATSTAGTGGAPIAGGGGIVAGSGGIVAGAGGKPGGSVAGTAGTGGERSGTGGESSGGEAGLGGAAGDAPSNEGGAAGTSNVEPTKAALHITWSLEGADSHNPLTCAVAGGVTISILSTPSGSSAPIEALFDCSLGQGSAPLDFGSYGVVTSLLNQQTQSLGDSSRLDVVLAASPCDQVVADRCVRNFTVKVLIDGK